MKPEDVPAELIDLAMTGAKPGCRDDAAFYLANVLPAYAERVLTAAADQLDAMPETDGAARRPSSGLRERLREALTRELYRRARERIEASPEDHAAAFADAVMPVVEAERKRAIETERTAMFEPNVYEANKALFEELDRETKAASAALAADDMNAWATHAGRGAELYEEIAQALGWRVTPPRYDNEESDRA